MDRRDFLRVTGAAGLATMWGSSLACAGSSAATTGAPRNAGTFSLSNVGLQLYTVRDAMGKDPDATLAAIAAAGYHLVETAGMYGRSAGDLRAMFDKHGIRTTSGHYALAELETVLCSTSVDRLERNVLAWFAARALSGYGPTAFDLISLLRRALQLPLVVPNP